ncbi:MAG: PKD domain-containing protein [Chitinophagales bacterium]|nr:PKD domain-containing protein [Chitinophagales bacterium]
MSSKTLIIWLSGLLCLPFIVWAGEGGELDFVPNRGQWAEPVVYKAGVQGGYVYFTKHGFRYSFYSTADMQRIHDHANDTSYTDETISCHAYDVLFTGSNQPVIDGNDARSYYHNYFLGNDPGRWASEVPVYSAVTYAGLYDNIDMRVYSKGTSLKYDMVVHPGGRTQDIRMTFDGVTPYLDNRGQLQIVTTVNTVTEQAPFAYQVVNNRQVAVRCDFVLSGNEVSFSFPDGYDRTADLVVDPALIFATYTGSTGDLWAYCATYDLYGNFYSSSEAYAPGFPVSLGAFQASYLYHDIAINKYDVTGSSLLYSTYCGGTYKEHTTAMIVNNNNELVISGQTYSSDFPVTNGAYDMSFNADSMRSDIFVTVFNTNGTGLVGSTFIGGSGTDGIAPYAFHDNDQNKSGLSVDPQDNIYVGATTFSKDFPVTPGAVISSPGSSYDGVVFKLSRTCGHLYYSTYLGGDHQDCIYDCKYAGNGKLVVCGRSISTDFPLSSNAYSDSGNAFVTILNSTGTAVVASTRLGNYSESALKVSLDEMDKVFVCGNNDTNFIIHNATFYQPKGKIFIAKLMPDLDSLILSTKIVNTPKPGVTGFVNICGDMVGSVYVKDSSNLPLTANAYQSDFAVYYFFHISPAMDSLIYATYYGVPHDLGGHTHGSSAIDTTGVIWMSSCNQASKHLISGTSGSYCPNSKSRPFLDNDHLSVKFDMDVLAVKPIAEGNVIDSSCMHTDVYFHNLSRYSYSWLWRFGDGDSSFVKNPVHKYDSSGTFIVTLEAYNPYSCKVVDILLDTIYIDSIEINAKLYAKDTACLHEKVSMYNYSTNAQTYYWQFGDGDTSTAINPVHVYNKGGTFRIMLVAYNPDLCNSIDTVYRNITIDDTDPGAAFSTSRTIACVDMPIQFQNSSARAVTFYWDFGDGNSSQLQNPAHSYNTWGIQNAMLIATNTALCVPNDTAYVPVEIKEPLRIELADSFICSDSITDWGVKLIHANQYVTYKWEPANAILSASDGQYVTVNPKISTKYFITVSDSITGLCSHVRRDTGNLIIVPYPSETYAFANTPLCEHDTLRLEAGSNSGMQGLVYNWTGPQSFQEGGQHVARTSLNRTHSGIYTVGIDNQGCTVFEEVEVLVKPAPQVKASSNSPLLTGRELKLYMESDMTPDSLEWGGPDNFFSTDSSPVISPVTLAAIGTYTLKVMVNGCIGGAITHVSVDEPDSQYIRLYPNPNNGTFYLEGRGHNEQQVKILILNSIGQRLYYTTATTEKKNFRKKIVLPAVSEGMYMLYMLMDGEYWPIPFIIAGK